MLVAQKVRENLKSSKLKVQQYQIILGLSASAVTSDSMNVFWLNRNGTISSVSKVKNINEFPLEYRLSDINLPEDKVSQILSVGSSLQPFPGKEKIVCISISNLKLFSRCRLLGYWG